MRPRVALFRVCLAGLAAVQLLAACQREPPPAATPEPDPSTTPSPPVAPPAPAVLDRARLLEAIDLAASAYAAGQADAGENMASRRFVIRQAFGCRGPAAAATPGLARWTWGAGQKTLDVSLAPADWTKDAVFSGPENPWEAVEGVWIDRPWMRDDGCPAAPAPALPPTPEDATSAPPGPPPPATPLSDPQVAGLAVVFAHDGSRVGRRDGKPFAFTLRAEGDTPLQAPQGGYRLVIEGRLTAFPNGRAIRCRAASPDVRPVCIAAAEVDRVAFEDAGGKVLREWRPG